VSGISYAIKTTEIKDYTYTIKTTEIKDYTYRTSLVIIDSNGEPQVEYSKAHPTHIKKLTLLNLVGRDQSGSIVTYEPLDYVNRFLMAHHIDDDKQESDQYSKGLVHFLSFLIQLQLLWDEEYDEELFDKFVDSPRPSWDYMELRKAERITYQYRKALKYSVLEEPNSDLRLARTTATAYMNSVVKFYSFHIRMGYYFNNPPFQHEVVNIHYQAGGSSMKSYMSKAIHTTDLRLNFPKSKKNVGGVLPSSKRGLRPLTTSEWKEAQNILTNTRTVVKNINGEVKTASFPIEYSLFFLIARFTGLRKEEVASLHKGQIIKPDHHKSLLRFGVGGKYGSLTKTKDGGNKSRRTIIPAKLMQKLYEYTRSDRYQKRLKKFKELCKQKRKDGDDAFFDGVDGIDENKDYLFISSTGKPFFTKLSEANTRWNEVRATIEKKTGQSVTGAIHNLRSTFGTNLFRALLRVTTKDIALALVSECFGHEDQDITLMYLDIALDDPTGDEVFEDILDYIGVFDDTDDTDDSNEIFMHGVQLDDE
jgi:hypothetical protein